MDRLQYQKQQSVGTILNIGCGDDPANFGASATHLDIDTWNLPNFVQGDCHNLPFGDKSFDTAVLGDVLEHCLYPEKAVQEAARVSSRLVMTIPEELSLPSVGQHTDLGVKARADHYRIQHGLHNMSDDEIIDFHKRTDSRFVKSVPESITPHDGHINRFDQESVNKLIEASKMKILDYRIETEVTWKNWLITLVSY